MAFEAKNYFINEERCEEVQLEQQTFCGKYAKNCKKEEDVKKETKKKKKKDGKKKKTEL